MQEIILQTGIRNKNRPLWINLLDGTMDRNVVTRTIYLMYSITVLQYRRNGRRRRIECHNVRTFYTLILSGNYNDRWGINEKLLNTEFIVRSFRTSQRTPHLLWWKKSFADSCIGTWLLSMLQTPHNPPVISLEVR